MRDNIGLQPEIHSDPGEIYRQAVLSAEAGNHARAIELARRLVTHDPGHLAARILLGSELAENREFSEAIDCFRTCIELSPPQARLHDLLGVALSEAGHHDKAREQFETALVLDPRDDQAMTRLAMALVDSLKMSEAEALLLQALSINPANALAVNNLGRVYKFQGRSRDASQAFRTALKLEPYNQVVVDNYLLTLNYLDDMPPEAVAQEHMDLCRQLFSGQTATHHQAPPGNEGNELIRVGYVSGDFHTHSVSFFLEPVLTHHNRKRFMVFCYSNGTVHDETSARFKLLADGWRDITTLSDSAAAERVQQDKINILIDLSGHSAGNRLGLFALKPARLQISWIGYPATTGLAQMDGFISDAICSPPGASEHFYCERLIRLPRVFSCYLPPLRFPAVAPAPSLQNGMITFGSFNHFAKVNDHVVALWAAVLRRVGNSRLLLKSMALGDAATQQRILESFARHGISQHRIALLHTVSSTMDHLELYGQVDIALDTFPYNGTTTTCEALWMGVPVITLAGRHHAARVGLSILSAIDLSELACRSDAAYSETAAQLADNLQKRLELREQLRAMMAHSPLMDAAGFTKELEVEFETHLSLLQKCMQETE